MFAVSIGDQVGVDLENGRCKLTATFPETPATPVLLQVGRLRVMITAAGDYPFLLDKGVEYAFGTYPFVSNVVYTAVDDLASNGASRSAARSWIGGSANPGVWTVDGGQRLFDVPSLLSFGYLLWLPTLQGSPDVEHLGTSASQVFTAQLSDYRDANRVAYHWTCSDENVVIASPNSQSTHISFLLFPGWKSASLRVTANIGSRILESVLPVSYGRHSTPQMEVSVFSSSHVWVNRPVEQSNVRHCSLSILSDIPTNGTFTVSFVGSQEHARVTPTSPWQFEVYEVNTAIPGEPYVREFATVEGLAPCDDCDEEYFAWTFVTADGVVLAGTNRFTVAQIEKVDVWSARGGESENPPPFPGQALASFRESSRPTPDRHYPIFFCDVVDTNLVVQPYSVEYRVTTIPRNFSIPYASTTLELLDGPESGRLRNCNGKTAYYDTPSEGGVYKVAVRYSDSPKTETILVLPLAGALVDDVISRDRARSDEAVNYILDNTLPSERQDIAFGLRWFNDDGMGDYRGRVDSHAHPMVWRYNQVNDLSGLGAVATANGVAIRMAKFSNFMVGYTTTRIGVSSSRRWWSQLIGTGNDATATMSWDAGVAVAEGAPFAATVSQFVTNAWVVSDIKEKRLWPNRASSDNHTSNSRIVNYNYSFCSPGFMERRPR